MKLKSSIKTNLCKTYRAAGLPKDQAHSLLNQVELWVNESGVEWTVSRLKGLHHWYITQLGGVPNIPSWVSRKETAPKGPFKIPFLMKNKQNALAILSSHTAFEHDKITQKQLDKLYSGLHAPRVQDILKEGRFYLNTEKCPKIKYSSPTLRCLTGVSIPCGPRKIRLQDSPKREVVADAYISSWACVPTETLSFIEKAGLGQHKPEDLTPFGMPPVGHISCIQEPTLKARWISNPNRITQHFLTPLGEVWAGWLYALKTDCTLNQERGIQWARSKLEKGITLAATDLESATDRLNLDLCLDYLHLSKFGVRIARPKDQIKWKRTASCTLYLESVNHFKAISAGKWLFGSEELRWDVGWPLGTQPSFPLLGLTNNLCAYHACRKIGLDPQDSYRVIGDDIVLDQRIADAYQDNIQSLGGSINPTKSIVSNRAVEFAGYVIDRTRPYLKRLKARGLSDNSYMIAISNMGDQAKWLLRPRQRETWDELKYVPGVAVGIAYSQQSFGEPLGMRYQWYLTNVLAEETKVDPLLLEGEAMALKVALAWEESQFGIPNMEMTPKEFAGMFIPRDIASGVHPDKTAYVKTQSTDPRRKDGLSVLEQAESIIRKDTFEPYQVFKERTSERNFPNGKPLPKNPSQEGPSR
jgi:hypothetical protein